MTVVACLGDSITEGSPYWDSRRRAGDPTGQWEHWAGLLHPELEFRNHGIWGERTDEIARRFDEAVAGADRLILQGGINDIAAGSPSAGSRSGCRSPCATCSRGTTAGLSGRLRSAR
jgi:lysophospholipase L1-like esterase